MIVLFAPFFSVRTRKSTGRAPALWQPGGLPGATTMGSDGESGSDLDDAFECPRCQQAFSLTAGRVPKDLPCGHLFCAQCLAEAIKGSVATCAECGAEHHLAGNGSAAVEDDPDAAHFLVARLPTNLVVAEFLRLLSPREREEDAPADMTPEDVPLIASALTGGTDPSSPDPVLCTPTRTPPQVEKQVPKVGSSHSEFDFDDDASKPLKFMLRTHKLAANRKSASMLQHAACVPRAERPFKQAVLKDDKVRPDTSGQPAAALGDTDQSNSVRGSAQQESRRFASNVAKADIANHIDDDDALLDLPLSRLPAKTASRSAPVLSISVCADSDDDDMPFV
jgi:hypothetical protein